MSDGISISFVDFAAVSFEFDRVRCALFWPFLVRNWCGWRPSPFEYSVRKVRKQRPCHLRCEILEQSEWPWQMAVAEKNEREIEGAEAPVGHDLDEMPVTHEFRLDNGR